MGGILDDAIGFYCALEADNTREFWSRERHRYDDGVKPLFAAILDGVGSFGPWRVYRPHNDTRFRATAPYKEFAGAVAERPDGVGAFVQVSARGVLIGTGIPMPAPDQLPRLRAAIAADRSGAAFETAIEEARAQGVRVHGGRYEPLARVPSGFPKDSPRADYLRWKGLEAGQRVERPRWRSIEDASDGIDRLLDVPGSLHVWIGVHVGPSSMTAEERFAPKKRTR